MSSCIQGRGWAADFERSSVVLRSRQAAVRVSFEGARSEITPKGDGNFLTHAELKYGELYPGIDPVYGVAGGQLKSEFRVAPRVDPGVIRMRYTGAETVSVDSGGNLVLITPQGDVFHEQAPELYQGDRWPEIGP
jgi:hypothetical protein